MMRNVGTIIDIGTPVKFDSDQGTQHGKVTQIKPDLSNGRRVAAVAVAGTLNGQPWLVPVDELRHAKAA